jgi:hypothetical protein
VGELGYTIEKVGRADRFDYPTSTVFYGPNGRDVGVRLARQLSVDAQETPGLGAKQLLVVVGPQTVASQ